ncbi:MAG TPA: cbb3-type cytochrome c oxidase subunit 3 [Hyphomicrobiales bacterium]|nr:cbb3-type cytochrome c oxidase subunit 3 [Hyphomicrobiales bacterium]
MEYETLRHFADTWGLVFLVVVFLGVIMWVMRPGSEETYEEAARIPLKED